MKKIIQLSLVLMLIFTGGCGMSKEKENGKIDASSMADTEAFKDEFTREFLTSNEEVEEGYYTFQSKTKGYTMLFPENAKISSGDYEQIENTYEALSFSENLNEENITYFISTNFEESSHAGNISLNTKILSRVSGYDGEYSKYELNDKTIYFGEKQNNDKGFYSYIAYIKSNNTDKGIRFIYNGRCLDRDQSCELSPSNIRGKIKKITDSIKFK
ncbi:hypothetical protein [Metabacillus hrfriensis]|uniref:Uncharacterized protein n=1 Tax=Metabacillus hrfriensis TaxID=3048891 RepID=A0ACD4RBG0_9BACI|nr:hypothetical protein [Metabacillus sp. CT-WN-B3]WHZ57784.1 hypothetical protein QLQ22_24625 [Metabacillus sp. CT-WN-B3]